MNQVLIGATYDMLIGDSQRINTTSSTFEHMHHLQFVKTPNLWEIDYNHE